MTIYGRTGDVVTVIRRGKLEAVFATLHRAMQSIYNAMTSLKLA